VKVLFDHNVPHKLRQSMIAHEVKTADEMGWAELGMASCYGRPNAQLLP
jgi:hypothetical protein